MTTITRDVGLSPKVNARFSPQFALGLYRLVLCVCGAIHIFGLITRKERFLRDFVQEWTSARNWRIGRPVYEDLRETIPFHFPKARAADLRFNTHPPAAVMLALPFGSLSYHHVLKTWSLLSLTCVVVALSRMMGRGGFDLSFDELLLVTGIMLSISVLATQLLQEPLNGVLLLLISSSLGFVLVSRIRFVSSRQLSDSLKD